MNRKTRKGLGAILASVGVTTLLGVMSGTGVVRADVDPQELPPADGTAADATATVEMKQRCQWYVSGVPSSITLVKTEAETSTVYDGTQFDLEADIGTISAFTDGNLVEPEDLAADSHTFCTLFGEQTGIAVTGSWDSGEFTATAADSACEVAPCVDENMDFTAGLELNPDLVLSIAEVADECRTPANDGLGLSDWTVNTDINQSDLVGTTIMALSATNATPVPKDEDRMNDACDADLSVTASIPAGKTPLYAGKSYSFSGPTFTTEIEITTDR